MKKQCIRLCAVVGILGVFGAATVFGSGPVPNVMGDPPSSVSFTIGPDNAFPQKATVSPAAPVTGMFSGDYVAAGVKAIGFKVNSSGPKPRAFALYLVGTSGNEWVYPIDGISANPAEWVTVVVPLDYSAGWTLYGGTEAMFYDDLQDVAYLNLLVLESGQAGSEQYTISCFTLLGGSSLATAQNLYAFQLQEGISDINGDADGDGLSNYGEYLSGTDANNSDEDGLVLNIQLVPNPSGSGVALKWKNNPNCEYAIWKASTPGEFTWDGIWLEFGAEADAVVPVAEDGNQPGFYRVKIRAK
jgi:hypothetical protein